MSWVGKVGDAGVYTTKYGSFTRLGKLLLEYWSVLSPFCYAGLSKNLSHIVAMCIISTHGTCRPHSVVCPWLQLPSLGQTCNWQKPFDKKLSDCETRHVSHSSIRAAVLTKAS
jgi:hypothetical protein